MDSLSRPRIILHVDMNSYFASVEQQANPFLRGKPIGVTGKRTERSVVAAASIEAKKLGVRTAMSTWEAKHICPSIILVAGDPEKYSEITHRFNAIFRACTPRVEQFSVDESFLDVTNEAQDYLGAIAMAQDIRTQLRETCGERITASIGIGPNKLMAKLASEHMKPDGLTVVQPHQVLQLLDASDLQDLCGIGPRIARRLADKGIFTVPQLREYPRHLLIEEFKSYGAWLHEAAHGRDQTPLLCESEPPKSVGHSYTFPKDLVSETEIKRGLLGLCDKVAWRLRRDGFVARSLSAYARFGDFSGTGQEHRFQEPMADGLALFHVAWSLLCPRLTQPVRLLGVSAGTISAGPVPSPLFKKDRRMRSTLTALDRVQSRYGEGAWTRASLLHVGFKARASGFRYDHEL